MKHLPNLLTAARLLASPYILYLLWTGSYRTALVWFAIASATDVLDGFLARRLQAGSRLGAMLDPIADKVLLSGSFLVLGWKSVIPFSLTIFVLGRDAMILGFALVALARKTHHDFPPSHMGESEHGRPNRVCAVCSRTRSRPRAVDGEYDPRLDHLRADGVERD